MDLSLRKLLSFIVAVICFASVSFAQSVLPGVVSDFELPRFDEDSGKKIWELFGKKAKFIDEKNIDVFDMRLVLFDKSTSVQRATITSATARVNMSTRVGKSEDILFVKGEEFDLTGKKWNWDGKNSIIEIFSNVEINFNPKKDSVKSNGEKISISRTKITGNSAKMENGSKENKFYIVGNAAVRGDNLVVDCHQIMAVSGGNETKSGAGDVSLLDAQGNVFMLRDNRTARAERAVIKPKENEAILTGNPELEDIASKVKLSGDKIVFLKEENSLKSYSSIDGKTRAHAVFFHTKDDKSKPEKIEITSNEILLTSGEKENKFVFNGNVVVKSSEFTARCGNITAFAKSVDSKKPEVNVIKCRNSVKLNAPQGDAFASEVDIFPKESKTELRRNVVLVNAKDGTKLTADKLVLFKDEDKGFATANRGKFVNLYISEEAASGASNFGQPATKQVRKTKKSKKNSLGTTVVSSRNIDFIRKDGVAQFNFKRDVSIASKQVRATCNEMVVYAHSADDNTSKISKIEAFESVRIVQNEYTAMSEYAVIYPKTEESKNSKIKNNHKFVELLVYDKKPNVRPRIMLPPMRNMGFEDSAFARKSRPKMTVITSDKQYLTSENNVEKYFFEGDVKISATDTEGSCKKIEVIIAPPSKTGRREISDIVLFDNVEMRQGLKEITCGKAHIYAKDEVAVLTKNPIVFNKEDNTRAAGEKIIYNKGAKLISVQQDESKTQEDEFDDVQKKRPQIILPEFNTKKVR